MLDWLSACTCFAWVLARGVVLFVRPHLSLLLLLGLPIPATATLADRAIVSTVGLVILVLLFPEPVRGNWRGPPHGFFVGAARKALVSCFLARVREAWYVREGSSRISSRRMWGTRPASKVAMSDVCHACLYGETLGGAVRLASASRRAYA